MKASRAFSQSHWRCLHKRGRRFCAASCEIATRIFKAKSAGLFFALGWTAVVGFAVLLHTSWPHAAHFFDMSFQQAHLGATDPAVQIWRERLPDLSTLHDVPQPVLPPRRMRARASDAIGEGPCFRSPSTWPRYRRRETGASNPLCGYFLRVSR